MDVIPRRAGRVIVVNDEGRVLMIRGFNPDKPDDFYWFTPGGGLEPGENTAQAAARELYEETGLLVAPDELVGPIYSEEIDLPFGGVMYRQTQDFYALRVPEWTVAPVRLDTVEMETIEKFEWLSLDEVIAAEAGPDAVYPPDLSGLLKFFLELG
jgi:8-oxo-dGTP pyrophosphatase MutT (NUDIX family)